MSLDESSDSIPATGRDRQAQNLSWHCAGLPGVLPILRLRLNTSAPVFFTRRSIREALYLRDFLQRFIPCGSAGKEYVCVGLVR